MPKPENQGDRRSVLCSFNSDGGPHVRQRYNHEGGLIARQCIVWPLIERERRAPAANERLGRDTLSTESNNAGQEGYTHGAPRFLSCREIELISLPAMYTSVLYGIGVARDWPSPRNKIMVIDYPTWKPPSGISITYVCIPTGNLPLIRSNSEVTQFTPASNLKWDCLMAQGTSKWAFPTSQERETVSIPSPGPGYTSYADDNPVTLLPSASGRTY